MTTSELLERVDQRLSGKGNPSLPPEATLKAILTLGKQKDAANKEVEELRNKVAELSGRLDTTTMQKEDAEFQAKQARDAAKEQEWIAHELGNFIRDVANSLYVGKEVAAAQRVYDLNKGSLRKVRRNAYNYETVEEAQMDFVGDQDKFLEWLYQPVAR